MASEKNNISYKINYSKEKDYIKKYGPNRLYLFYGEEEYLKEQLLNDIKIVIFSGSQTDFSYKKFIGSGYSLQEISAAINSPPFLSDRTLVEIRDCDINKNSDFLYDCITDIPDYCTVVFILNSEYTPDFRCKVIKYISSNADCFEFPLQSHEDLSKWIRKRFKAENKIIEDECIQELIFLSGESMTGLIPEISKIASYSSSEHIQKDDIRLCAHHIPEADVFEIINLISDKKLDDAFELFNDLLSGPDFDPIYILSLLDLQFRRIYACKVAKKLKLGSEFLFDCGAVNSKWLAKKIFDVKSKYTIKKVADVLATCVEYDYKLKNESVDSNELFKSLFLIFESEN